MGCDAKLNPINPITGALALVPDELNILVHVVTRRWLSNIRNKASDSIRKTNNAGEMFEHK
jgi:hypothetical protein